MLFLNAGNRNAIISGVSTRDRSSTNKMGHSFIICGCLSIMIGLILIVIGVISENKKTTFIGVGIISLGMGFFLMTLVCLYGKLDICYNNWAYRSRVLPLNLETPRLEPAITTVPSSPAVIQKQQSLVPKDSQAAITVTSDIDIHKVIITSSVEIPRTTNNNNNIGNVT